MPAPGRKCPRILAKHFRTAIGGRGPTGVAPPRADPVSCGPRPRPVYAAATCPTSSTSSPRTACSRRWRRGRGSSPPGTALRSPASRIASTTCASRADRPRRGEVLPAEPLESAGASSTSTASWRTCVDAEIPVCAPLIAFPDGETLMTAFEGIHLRAVGAHGRARSRRVHDETGRRTRAPAGAGSTTWAPRADAEASTAARRVRVAALAPARFPRGARLPAPECRSAAIARRGRGDRRPLLPPPSAKT